MNARDLEALHGAHRAIEQSYSNVLDLIAILARNRRLLDESKAVVIYDEIKTNLLRKREHRRTQKTYGLKVAIGDKYSMKTYAFSNFVKKHKIDTGFKKDARRNCGKGSGIDSNHYIKHCNKLQTDMLHLIELVELSDDMKYIVIKELISIYDNRSGLSAPKVAKLERELFNK